MTLILHLSDLHLGQNDDIGDYKSKIVPAKERATRRGILQATLGAINRHLRAKQLKLDAVAISGDVTTRGEPDGLAELSGLLEFLGDSLPCAERIVVVPGNHDVTWGTPPSSTDRYAHFIQFVRSAGYTTPLIDGIDIDSEGRRLTDTRAIVDLGSSIVVPINSCNYSGTLEPLSAISEDEWRTIPSLLRGSNDREVEDELRRLRMHDVARISPQQLSVLAEQLRAADTPCHDEAPRVRLAMLHHQLLPVSTQEEFKSFEVVTNLGQLRRFLRDNRISVLLHGHKHVGFVYPDRIYDYGEAGFESASAHEVMVVSGSTLGGEDNKTAEVGRLIDVRDQTAAPEIVVQRIRAVEPGSTLGEPERRIYALWGRPERSATGTGVQVVRGQTIDDVYDRMTSFVQRLASTGPLTNLVCEIERVPEEVVLPKNYPSIPGTPDEGRGAWLDAMVSWWQRSGTRLKPPYNFTHGERIRAYRSQDRIVNQLREAWSAINAKTSTSRAVITLIDPHLDMVKNSRQRFPAFCLVQFVVVNDNSGRFMLNTVAYFRKQELRYWWAVNIAEIVRIRREVYQEIRGSIEEGGVLELGSISTIAAIVSVSSSCPKVAVPLLDRLLDQDPEALWKLAYALVWPGFRGRRGVLRQWGDVLTDLVPPDLPDPDGGPITMDGLEVLIGHLVRFTRYHEGAEIRAVVRSLEQLLGANQRYAAMAQADGTSAALHSSWRADCITHVEDLRRGITSLSSQPLASVTSTAQRGQGRRKAARSHNQESD